MAIWPVEKQFIFRWFTSPGKEYIYPALYLGTRLLYRLTKLGIQSLKSLFSHLNYESRTKSCEYISKYKNEYYFNYFIEK